MLDTPDRAAGALGFLVESFRRDLGQGGTFDYQRDGPFNLRQYRHVSNFNVGLYIQQSGLSLDQATSIAGAYGTIFSRNYDRSQPYGVPPENRHFMELGFRAGQSGIFGAAP
jgi:hypothetical protein